MTPETRIVRAILAYLRTVPRCKALKMHGSPFTESGTPDILVCVDGRLYLWEVKARDMSPTPLQVQRMREWRAAGARVAVVRSLDDVREILTHGCDAGID